jgi:hypothetical protein
VFFGSATLALLGVERVERADSYSGTILLNLWAVSEGLWNTSIVLSSKVPIEPL